MFHFDFHIGDYMKATAHLSNEEDLCYRRLLDMYYDTEAPIPLETDWVARRLRIGSDVVTGVLQDFFIQREDGWHSPRCDEEIDAYHAKAEQARINGKSGGRPKKTKPVTDRNRIGTGSKPDRKLTVNRKPLTVNQEPESQNLTPDGVSAQDEISDKKLVFDFGAEVLKSKGVPEKNIGALIGKMVKTVGEEESLGILGGIQAKKGDLNVVGYITAALKGKSSDVYRNLKKRYGSVECLPGGGYNCGGRIFAADGSGGLCV